MTIAGALAGRITFQLYRDAVPDTCENFRVFCTGEKGTGHSGKPLHFKGSPFHRVVPGFRCEGGDLIYGTGKGGESIPGARFETGPTAGKAQKHTGVGCLSMANTDGKSQFHVWLGPYDHPLEGVVFGTAIEGHDVLALIEAMGTFGSGHPLQLVVIADCGEII